MAVWLLTFASAASEASKQFATENGVPYGLYSMIVVSPFCHSSNVLLGKNIRGCLQYLPTLVCCRVVNEY